MYQMIGGLGSVKSDYLDKNALSLTIAPQAPDLRCWRPDNDHPTPGIPGPVLLLTSAFQIWIK